MITHSNPFALVKASDITDQLINDLWVELGHVAIRSIIEPTSTRSKFILGGKGTGKTHILRYYSYSAVKLRGRRKSGLDVIAESKFLAVFLRASGLDAPRFEIPGIDTFEWQQLFSVYLELCLAQAVLDALADVVVSTPGEEFNQVEFIQEIQTKLAGADLSNCNTIVDLKRWVLEQTRSLDDAVNNAAYTRKLDVRVPFSIGKLAIPIARAMGKLHSRLADIPLIYLIDEIENFSVAQQQVVNTLIRYGEGLATFRVTGRLYARKTKATLADGEENREHAEFKTEILDEKLRNYPKYPEFCSKFVRKRLLLAGMGSAVANENFSPASCFEEIDQSNFYNEAINLLGVADGAQLSLKNFSDELRALLKDAYSEDLAQELTSTLTEGLPPLLQKLNIVLFCKKLSKRTKLAHLAGLVRQMSDEYFESHGQAKGPYATAYGHYSTDLFSQICRDSRRALGVPYAGFEVFTRMSWGNPRNLLIVLGHAYEIARFKEIDFINGRPLSIQHQTQAAVDAARFAFENDSNYGRVSDVARDATRRLGEFLRTARFSLRIPEVSPLAVSFSEDDLSPSAREVLNAALNYSLIYEVYDGRPDRNTKILNRKIQLNAMLSPRWGLPVVRRGDISLNRDLLDAIFVEGKRESFDALLKAASLRWNSVIRSLGTEISQPALF
ncbi:ORC-CDC6 family AAA ATPase [Pseudoduganella albidiflava]|uniref:ATP-binding protein n=1 Tax=Pseudoduganella albidiflava TaxID=321983 RepID=A0A411X674_9BURK|nr:hypothetical protein [Pseudoduganella albidiflava]QBI04521.1 hypothetical protein EYF70_29645 [Pseudoduganella albidiflava]GGY28007.1 hypothetical protein GCM10007387_07600 [Pseudoduganella albidiflava]